MCLIVVVVVVVVDCGLCLVSSGRARVTFWNLDERLPDDGVAATVA